jgi:hypothetical protein
MTTKEICINELLLLKTFFEIHNVEGWMQRTENAILEISDSRQELQTILHNYFGMGMGSLVDLIICKHNGHVLHKSEKETNEELQCLAEKLVTIKCSLK